MQKRKIELDKAGVGAGAAGFLQFLTEEVAPISPASPPPGMARGGPTAALLSPRARVQSTRPSYCAQETGKLGTPRDGPTSGGGGATVGSSAGSSGLHTPTGVRTQRVGTTTAGGGSFTSAPPPRPGTSAPMETVEEGADEEEEFDYRPSSRTAAGPRKKAVGNTSISPTPRRGTVMSGSVGWMKKITNKKKERSGLAHEER